MVSKGASAEIIMVWALGLGFRGLGFRVVIIRIPIRIPVVVIIVIVAILRIGIPRDQCRYMVHASVSKVYIMYVRGPFIYATRTEDIGLKRRFP